MVIETRDSATTEEMLLRARDSDQQKLWIANISNQMKRIDDTADMSSK